MTIEVLENIKLLAREKGIEEEILIDALKNAIEAAARKKTRHKRSASNRV
jgi:hypothetical protein